MLAAIIQIVACVLHLLAMASMVGVIFACKTQNYNAKGYVFEPLDTCSSKLECYRQGKNWANDAILSRHEWNPFGMVLLFETISASFAIFYLRDNPIIFSWVKQQARILAPAINLVGLGAFLVWFSTRDQVGWCQIIAGAFAVVFSTMVQTYFDIYREAFAEAHSQRAPPAAYQICNTNGIYFQVPGVLGNNPQGVSEAGLRIHARLNTLLRYGEYCASAPILFIAVLSVFALGPPSWTFILGFAGILLCNILGFPLHLLHVGAREAPNEVLKNEGDSGNRLLNFMGFGNWHDIAVAELEMLRASWLGLSVGLISIWCVGRTILFNASIPMFVLVVLWNMIFSYTMFGIAGTIFYLYDGLWKYMDTTYDILSIVAKIPIAVSICIGFLQMPGGGCR